MRRSWLGPSAASRGFSAMELTGVLTIIALVAGLILVWADAAQGRAREAACQSNLRQIGLALHLYASDYGGRLPPSSEALPQLASAYVKNEQILRCVADRTPRVVEQGGAKYEVSYFIVPGVATDDPPSTIIAGDNAARHRGGWYAVHVDGRCDRLPARELPPGLTEGESQHGR